MIGHRGETFFDGPFIWSGKIHPLDERFMAKSDPNNTFGDFSKIKLSPDRLNLKPVDPNLTFEQYLTIAIKEGYALLAAEATSSVKKPNSVKAPQSPKSDSVKLENKLGEMSKNAYVRAREEVLKKMKPETRAIIEKMERNEMERDSRWDTFCKAVTIKGDQISNSNN